MNKNDLLNAIKKVKEVSPKRKFKQTYDLIVTLKHLDLKKPEHQVDLFVQLHHPRGKQVKVCTFAAPELKESSQKNCDMTVEIDDFDKYAKDKKLTKKLAVDYDFFIAQATIMPKVAAAFGRILGPKGKMPNPKAGCVVPPNANLAPLVEKLKNTVRVSVKTAPMLQCRIGNEEMSDDQIVDNCLTVYNNLTHALPSQEDNIKNICLKLTMGPCVKVGALKSEEEKGKKSKSRKAVKLKASETSKKIASENAKESKVINDPKKVE